MLSGVASQSISSVFSSTYTHYKILFQAVANIDNAFRIRMRSGSTDASGANYTFQELQANNTSVSGSRTSNGTSYVFAVSDATTKVGVSLEIFTPFIAEPTSFVANGNRTQNTSQYFATSGVHTLSTSYDGFTIINDGANTMTGNVSVYGYNK